MTADVSTRTDDVTVEAAPDSQSDAQIALLVILPTVAVAAGCCLLLALFLWLRRRSRSSSKERQPLKQQLAAVRPDHPVAFVLPTVTISETGSEPVSDLSALSHSSSSSSLATMHSSRSFGASWRGARPREVFNPETLSAELYEYASPVTSPDTTSESEGAARFSSAGSLGFCLRYDVSRQHLTVRIIGARHLPAKIRKGSADAYVKVTVLPDKAQKYTTRVVRNTQDPSFNEEFVFALRRAHLDSMALRLTVCDYDKFSRRLVLGHVLFPLSTANISSKLTDDVVTGETWMPLEERLAEHELAHSKGQLEVSMCYVPDAEMIYAEALRARDLRMHDTELVSMFVKLSWYERKRLARTKKSRPCKHTRDPQLSERLTLAVQRSFLSDVCLVVTVCARNKIGVRHTLGRCCIGPITYTTGTGLQHWNNMLHSTGKAIKMWHDLT
ncbi:synaptotagmin-1-like [Amphibalanus amphitrite]|uniref:synaptotagmin-1-like n=1 Tax=Amphibalanus amphitrite TaxID=1232801 RepID=UPI001C90FF8E|nr:synaptotagmin-1-like [Amphibalanus amphitrite]